MVVFFAGSSGKASIFDQPAFYLSKTFRRGRLDLDRVAGDGPVGSTKTAQAMASVGIQVEAELEPYRDPSSLGESRCGSMSNPVSTLSLGSIAQRSCAFCRCLRIAF
jgi:hypothetical protein